MKDKLGSLSMCVYGGLRVRKEEELERKLGCSVLYE